jgi:hypothetical protein
MKSATVSARASGTAKASGQPVPCSIAVIIWQLLSGVVGNVLFDFLSRFCYHKKERNCAVRMMY